MYRPPISKNENPRPSTLSSLASGSLASGSLASGKLASGTMASLTKSKEPTKSYSNRFSEQTRLRNDPTYVPPQKAVNISSDDDFPSLGSSAVKPSSWASNNCIKMAEEWGKKIKEEDEAHRASIIKADLDRRMAAKEQMKEEKMQKMNPKEDVSKKSKLIIAKNKNKFYDQYEHKFKSIENEIEEDSFESGPSHDEEEVDDEDINDDEFNTDIGYERRHKDELY